MHRFTPLSALAGFCAAGLLFGLSGCAPYTPETGRSGAPESQLANVRSRPLPAGTRRVLAFPLHLPQAGVEAQRDLDAVFATELNRQQRFEIVRLSRAELSSLTQREEISSTESFPADALAALKEKYAPDAILLTDITTYRPYRPVTIGIRSRLLDARNLSEIWATDVTLDASHPDVERAALGFVNERDNGPKTGLILQSPRRFAQYAAHEAFATLPVR